MAISVDDKDCTCEYIKDPNGWLVRMCTHHLEYIWDKEHGN